MPLVPLNDIASGVRIGMLRAVWKLRFDRGATHLLDDATNILNVTGFFAGAWLPLWIQR